MQSRSTLHSLSDRLLTKATGLVQRQRSNLFLLVVDLDAGLAELFEEFRAAEEEEIEDQADFETHYNMGTAYKEMDLLDEAMHEFQNAATAVKPADGTSRYLQCCNMLGHCFMQQRYGRRGDHVVQERSGGAGSQRR